MSYSRLGLSSALVNWVCADCRKRRVQLAALFVLTLVLYYYNLASVSNLSSRDRAKTTCDLAKARYLIQNLVSHLYLLPFLIDISFFLYHNRELKFYSTNICPHSKAK